MPIKTDRDMENAWLAGKSKFERWQRDYEFQSTKDTRDAIMTLAAKKLTTLPPAVQEYYQVNHPAEWKAVQKIAQGKDKKGR